MSTVKRWKIKEHYVAGEFAGYVVVTDDKYEDVVCRGIGVDYRDDAVLIASAPALKAECSRLREALNLIGTKADFCADECEYGPDATSFRLIADDAKRALKGEGDE